MSDQLMKKAIEEITKNHAKIIDDWCKAYMAELYEQGVKLMPGCFELIERQANFKDGKVCKAYYFRKREEEKMEEWRELKTAPEDTWIVLGGDGFVDFGIVMDGKAVMPDHGYMEMAGVTHWMDIPEPPTGKDMRGKYE